MKKGKVAKILLKEEEIKKKIKELGEKISEDYKGKNLLLVNILKGGVVFLADLMREINENVDVEIDFMSVSSYGSNTTSSGTVKIILDLKQDIKGKDVLIIEDIVDTGITLNYLKESLLLRQPNSLEICTLLDKKERRKANINVKYVGFEIPDEFVVGYGLDYDESYRNLPYIGVLEL